MIEFLTKSNIYNKFNNIIITLSSMLRGMLGSSL